MSNLKPFCLMNKLDIKKNYEPQKLSINSDYYEM